MAKVLKKKKEEIRFPRNLYKQEGPLKLYSKGVCYPYATVIVENKKEYDEVLKKGYYDDFGVVILGTVEAEKEVIEDNDDF